MPRNVTEWVVRGLLHVRDELVERVGDVTSGPSRREELVGAVEVQERDRRLPVLARRGCPRAVCARISVET